MKPFFVYFRTLIALGLVLIPAGLALAQAPVVDLFYEYYPLGPGLIPMGRSTDVDTARYAGPLQIRPAQGAAATVDDCFIDSLGLVTFAESGVHRTVQTGDTLSVPFQPDNMEIVYGLPFKTHPPVSMIFNGEAVHVRLEPLEGEAYSLHNAHLSVYYHFSRLINWVQRHDVTHCFHREFVYIQLDYAGHNAGTRLNFNVRPQVFELYAPMAAAYYSDVLYHECGHMIHNSAITEYFFRDKVLRGTVSAGISEAMCDAVAYTLNARRDSAYVLAEGYPEITIDFRGLTRMQDQMVDELRDLFLAMLVRVRRELGEAVFDPLIIRMMAESKIFVNALIERWGEERTRNYSLLLTDMAHWLRQADTRLYRGAHLQTIDSILSDMHLIPPGTPLLSVSCPGDLFDSAVGDTARCVQLSFPEIPGASHFVFHWKFWDKGWADARNVHGFVPTRQLLIKGLSRLPFDRPVRLDVLNLFHNGDYDPYLHLYRFIEDPRDVLFGETPSENYYAKPWVEIVSQQVESDVHTLLLRFPPWWGDEALHAFRLGAVWEGSKEPGWSEPVTCTLRGGGVTVSAVADDVTGQPEIMALLPNFPNPFNAQTELHYTLDSQSEVLLTIYDIRGRRVTSLVRGVQPAGRHAVFWDGTASSSVPAPSGLYIARLVVGDRQRQIKMMLLR